MENRNIIFNKTPASKVRTAGCTCEILDPNDPQALPKIISAKQIYVQSIEKKGIVGFSFEVDKIFDPFSLYFVAEKSDEIVAFLRMVSRTPRNRLPFETGFLVDSVVSQTIGVGNFVELTTFWCKDFLSLEPLAKIAFEHLHDANVLKVYSTKEAGETRIGSIYKRLGFEHSKTLKNVYYPAYGRVGPGGLFHPIVWEIYEGDQSMIIQKLTQFR